ncbi:MAG: hypothetical protein NTW03_00790 [Verrucomicrobia bacterium]|nr:hypothetical protein [Verrucomicrobiota bacterium]
MENYPGEVERLANIIRSRKPVGEPTHILFVCLEGVMASDTTCSIFNQLARELGISDIIMAHASNLFLDDVPAHLKGRISFIVPKLTPSWDSTIDKNTHKLGGHPRILKETAMRGAALYDPTPYKEFMLSILREIAVSQAGLPLPHGASKRPMLASSL